MRSGITLFTVLALAIAAFALGPDAEPALAAETGYHYSFAGKGADAGWSSCPAGAVVNQVCTDTYVGAAEQVYKVDGTKFPSTTLFFYQYSYKIDRKGNWISVSDVYGYGDATLTVDRQLKSASASATVPLTTCTVDRRGNYSCVESGVVTVSASWTGQGDLVKSNGNSHTVSKAFTYNSHSRGTYRDAVAYGQVNGVDLGTSYYASLYDSGWTDIYIDHSR